jgi:hypothetical protein
MKSFLNILIIFLSLSLISSYNLKFFKVDYPDSRAKSEFPNSWITISSGDSWQTYRFDLHYSIQSKESYDTTLKELNSLNEFLNCNIIGNTELRCIFWGDEISSLTSKDTVGDTVSYKLKIKNARGKSGESEIHFILTDSGFNDAVNMLDSVISHQEPSRLMFLA